jgi:hypothetical protein
MAPLKRYWALLVIPLVLCVGIFLLFYRMSSKDTKALDSFSAAYKNYDQAISDFSKSIFAGTPTSDDIEQKAEEAQAELSTKASARISSLTKNDGELMPVMLEIADLSRKELDTVAAYKSAVADQSGDISRLANELSDVANKRQEGYAHFLELAGLK